MSVILGIILLWVIAELGSAIIHMLEDSYGNPEWYSSKSGIKKFLYYQIVESNILHHKQPAAMLKGSFLYRNYTSIIPAWILATISYFVWPDFWPVWGGFILMGFANEIHGWSHQKCSWPIRFLQNIGILQSPKHHKIHHTKPYSTRYCVMSGWLNPILEFIYFWQFVRFVIWLLTGVRPLEIRKND